MKEKGVSRSPELSMAHAWCCLVTRQIASWQHYATFFEKAASQADFKAGRFEHPQKDSARNLDAMTAVASVLFNLDAALTR